MKTLFSLLFAGCLAILPRLALGAPSAVEAPVAAASPASAFVSPSLAETIRMIRAGVDDSVLLTFVQRSAGTLNLGADQIVFLRDLGASPELLEAMMRHDRELTARALRSGSTLQPVVASVRWQELTTVAIPDELAGWQPEAGYGDLTSQLAPYGQWFQLDGYGWCWRPWIATLRPTWQPYCQGGRWLLSDHGWYWASDFSWGGIVFHYGRWFFDDEAGWCWWPDTRWSPAWVTWRTGAEVVAWAPLPPGSDLAADGQGLSFLGETMPWNHDFNLAWEDYMYSAWPQFYSAEPGRNRLRGNGAADAYLDSAPLNDFFRSSAGNAVNRGVPLATVMRASGAVLLTVPVRDVPLTPGRSVEPDRVVNENGALRILRPSATVSPSPITNGAVTPTPAFTWAPSQPLPKFSTPWPGPVSTAARVAQPTEFERLAEELLNHPTYEPAPEQPKSAYPVPPRHPVKLTDPILVPRPYSSVTANFNVIRLFPR